MRTTLIASVLISLAAACQGAAIPGVEEAPSISPQLASLSHPRMPLRPQALPQAVPHNEHDEPSATQLEEQGERMETRKHHSRAKRFGGGKVTYYYGSQLLNPACPGASTPNDSSMTAAVSFDSPFQCGDRIKISDPHGKHAIVTVVDKCAACTWNWIDVTKGVFRVFSNLDAGVLNDLTMAKQ